MEKIKYLFFLLHWFTCVDSWCLGWDLKLSISGMFLVNTVASVWGARKQYSFLKVALSLLWNSLLSFTGHLNFLGQTSFHPKPDTLFKIISTIYPASVQSYICFQSLLTDYVFSHPYYSSHNSLGSWHEQAYEAGSSNKNLNIINS